MKRTASDDGSSSTSSAAAVDGAGGSGRHRVSGMLSRQSSGGSSSQAAASSSYAAAAYPAAAAAAAAAAPRKPPPALAMSRGSERPLLLAGRPLYVENHYLLRDLQVNRGSVADTQTNSAAVFLMKLLHYVRILRAVKCEGLIAADGETLAGVRFLRILKSGRINYECSRIAVVQTLAVALHCEAALQ
jgi:hypothetical protein